MANAAGNVDFGLVVGVDTSLSFKQMMTDINAVVNQINQNPPKIKIGIDTSHLSSQIQSQLNGSSASPKRNVSSGIGDKMFIKGSKEQIDALTKINSLINTINLNRQKWTKAKNGVSRESYENLGTYVTVLEDLKGQVVDASIPINDFNTKLASTKGNVDSANKSIALAGENTKTWTERMGGLAEKFNTWFTLSRVIMAAYRAVRQMVSSVIELDTAMTELKKVTDETDETYQRFLGNASTRAKRLGASLTDVVKTTADFARLGLSLEDAEVVSDAAIVYKNVGDGIENIDQASESLISTMQAFGIEAKDVMSIVDKFNITGNNFAISSGGVGEALLNSASALSAAGNTIDESIALITAANEVIQNPEKVGTAMKTLSMYIRAAKTEAETAGIATDGMANSVSELREELLALTGNRLDIMLDDGDFKSTYQIIKEISEIWSDLSETSQSNITELIGGGVRNANVINALMTNMNTANEVVEKTADSAGSALAENEKVLNSIQGKINVFNATFEELSQSLISSGFVKDIVDLGTGLLNILLEAGVLIEKLGGLNNVLIITAGILATIKADAIVSTIDRIYSVITGVIPSIKSFGIKLLDLPLAMRIAKEEGKGLSAALDLVGISASTAQIAIAALAAVLTIAIIAVNEYNQKQAEIRRTNIDNAKAAKEEADALRDLIAQYKKLAEAEKWDEAERDQVKSLQEQITNLVGIQAGNLDLVNGKLDEEIKKLDEIATKTAEQNTGTMLVAKKSAEDTLMSSVYDQDWYASKVDPDIYNGLWQTTGELDAVTAVLSELGLSKYDAGGFFRIDTASVDTVLQSYNDMLKLQEHLVTNYEEEISTGGDLNDFYSALSERINNMRTAVEDYHDAISNYNANEAVKELGNYLKTNDIDSQESFDNYIKGVQDSTEYSDSYKEVLINLANNTFPQFANSLDKTTKNTNNATDAVKDLKGALSSLSSVGKDLDQLDKIYADILNGGDFDYASLIDEGFVKAFSGLDKYDNAYSNFVETVANSPKDINACQEAFNNLSTAYITESGILSNVNDKTRDLTVAYLEQMGVANAATLVDEQLAVAKEKTRIATEAGSNATYNQILELYDEETASRITAQAIYELAIAKLQTNENTLLTSSDIAQLEALAEAAGATSESLLNVAKAKSYITEAEALEKQKADLIAKGADPRGISAVSTQASNYRLWAEELLNKKITYDVDFKRASYTGGSSTDSAKNSSAKQTWFEKQYNEHQHLLAIEQETEYEYLKWLESAHKKAYDEGIIDLDNYYRYAEEVYQGLRDLFDETATSAKDALDELADYRIDILKQELEDEKDALDERLDNLKEFYNKQKEMLQDQYDEEKYLEEQAEKRKPVSDLKSELDQLQYDDSAWAQKRKLEIQEELTTAEKELADFENENALDKALEALDNAYNSQEAQIQAEMEALEDKLNNPQLLFNRALSDITNNTGLLYAAMLEYNRLHGTGNDEDVKSIYEEAYKTFDAYKQLFGKDYQGIVLPNSTGYEENSATTPTTSDSNNVSTSTTETTKPSLEIGSSITVKPSATHFSSGVRMASYVPGGTYTVYDTSGEKVLIGRNGVYTGWINKSDIVGYASGTRNATPGLHRVNEFGAETLFESADGSRYRLFSGGEKVLNAKASEFLYQFANSGGEILSKIIGGTTKGGLLNAIQPTSIVNEIRMGDINISGSADRATVSEIRRAQRDSISMILKEFTKLQK